MMKVTKVINEAVAILGRNQNKRTCRMNMTRNVARRVIRSATNGVSEAGYSYHAAGDDRAHFCQFLKNGSFLRDDGNTRARVQKKKQPKGPPLPRLQCFSEHVIVSGTLRTL